MIVPPPNPNHEKRAERQPSPLPKYAYPQNPTSLKVDQTPGPALGHPDGNRRSALHHSHPHPDGVNERPEWGMKTRSRGQGRTAGVGFESGPLLPMICDGDF